MKKLTTLCIGALLSAGLAGPAVAENWSPTGSITLSNVGTITVQKGITLSCGLTGTGTLNGSSASVNSLALTGGLCGSISFTGAPYNIEPTSSTSVTIQNVTVTAITGNCQGNLVGAFDQSTGRITFSNATIPSSPAGGSPCRVTGVVATSPAASYTYP